MCIRGGHDLMRNAEGDCPGQRSERPPRLNDPMEQARIVGNSRAVRWDDR